MESARIMQTGTHPAADAAPRSPAPCRSATGGQECGLPARKRPRWPLSQEEGGATGPGWVVPFIRCRRAAATALTAAVMTIMSVAGFAFTSDHTHLVYQRDILKAATDAATLAATRSLRTLDTSLSTEAVTTALMPIARRYILANIPEGRRERAAETLAITLTYPSPGQVNIVAQADLGGIIFGSWMYGDVVSATRVDSLSDPELADGTTDEQTTPDTPPVTELVLAIDVTGSMRSDLNGNRPHDSNRRSRLAIVKEAAQELIDTITADASRTVVVGLVPWHYRVQFDSATRIRWEDRGWAQYPNRRYYPNPHLGSWKNMALPEGWYPDPHVTTAGGKWYDLPSKPEAWQGCVDQRRMSGDNPPGLSAVLPTVEPFTMGFYSPIPPFIWNDAVSFQCAQKDPTPDRAGWGGNFKDLCFDGTTEHPKWAVRKEPQFNCGLPTIVPLTADADTIKRKINVLSADGNATYSTLGVIWGHRLLAPAWRTIWGDAVHPVDAVSNVRKVLVLLTDGADNHLTWAKPGEVTVPDRRLQACTAAKDAGIEIITVFAGDPSRGLKDELEKCASPVGEDADEDATNSFTGTTQEELEGAFETIGQRLRPLRLMR